MRGGFVEFEEEDVSGPLAMQHAWRLTGESDEEFHLACAYIGAGSRGCRHAAIRRDCPLLRCAGVVYSILRQILCAHGRQLSRVRELQEISTSARK